MPLHSLYILGREVWPTTHKVTQVGTEQTPEDKPPSEGSLLPNPKVAYSTHAGNTPALLFAARV